MYVSKRTKTLKLDQLMLLLNSKFSSFDNNTLEVAHTWQIWKKYNRCSWPQVCCRLENSLIGSHWALWEWYLKLLLVTLSTWSRRRRFKRSSISLGFLCSEYLVFLYLLSQDLVAQRLWTARMLISLSLSLSPTYTNTHVCCLVEVLLLNKFSR